MLKNLIVIDGADGVGKSTQFELLEKRLKNHVDNNGKQLLVPIKFPRYKSLTGFYIKKYLNGELNNIYKDLDIYDKIKKISLLYTMDRVLAFRELSLSSFNGLLCDRYYTSSFILLGAELYRHTKDEQSIVDFIKWSTHIETEVFNLPKPTKVIYLDAPVSILLNNIRNRNSYNDINETEESLLSVENVKNIIFKYTNWNVINCVDSNNKMRDKKFISDEIYTMIDLELDKLNL